MPKLIDYPRTNYTGAWEIAEVTDDTGGKCSVETAARKLDRKVSGSFKAIIGSAVKFGLLTSKRDLLTTTTLFKRIKHAYDKQEELIFHREAFLTPPLFTQICRKFRGRELPIQMLDVMLIREFGVEEINAQGVAKAFVDGCRMVGLLDERNIMADIDALNSQKSPRRELANPQPTTNAFQQNGPAQTPNTFESASSIPALFEHTIDQEIVEPNTTSGRYLPLLDDAIPQNSKPNASTKEAPDAIASLFGLLNSEPEVTRIPPTNYTQPTTDQNLNSVITNSHIASLPPTTNATTYQIQVSGPGISTALSIIEEEDIALAIALLEKIRRQLKNKLIIE